MRRVSTITAAVALLVLAAAVSTSAAELPRGVMTELRKAYEGLDAPGATFRCLNGQGNAIPAGYVNDEYCDCADGSDEPGTAACTYLGDRFPSQLKFQCTNEGFAPQTFFHSRVNDGICDCCDGSDEYLAPAKGGVTCANTCAQAHEKEQRDRAAREKVRQEGLAARASLVAEAAGAVQGLKEKLVELHNTLLTVDSEIAAAEKEKVQHEEVEQRERDEIRKRSEEAKVAWDEEKRAKAAAAEAELARKREAGEPVEPEPAAVAEEEPAAVHWEPQGGAPPNVICTKWRQTGDCKGNGPRQPEQDRECDAVIDSGASGFCECVDTRTGLDVEYPFNCDHRKFTCQKLCEAEGKDAGFLTEAERQPEQEKKEEEFQLDTGANHFNADANAARSRLEDAKRKKADAERGIAEIEAQTKGDEYGPDNVFLPLKGKCFDRNEGHYTYTVCPFDRVKQGHTNMGSWKSWGEQTYGSWGGKHDFAKMIYADGERCWSGPSRSTEVRVVCGPTNEVLSVDEPSMCTYKMVFQTPAICE
jgi:protein kinase C substrate 80K-H